MQKLGITGAQALAGPPRDKRRRIKEVDFGFEESTEGAGRVGSRGQELIDTGGDLVCQIFGGHRRAQKKRKYE